MEYGYARCSTNSNKQDIDRQKRELILMGIKKENIFWEYGTGERNDREKLQQLLETVKQGDTIACTEVSRLSRSTKQLCEILEFVEKNKIKLIVGTFIVDCRNDEIEIYDNRNVANDGCICTDGKGYYHTAYSFRNGKC